MLWTFLEWFETIPVWRRKLSLLIQNQQSPLFTHRGHSCTEVYIFHRPYFQHSQWFLWTQNVCFSFGSILGNIKTNPYYRCQLCQHMCDLNNHPSPPPTALLGYQTVPTVIEIHPPFKIAHQHPATLSIEELMLENMHTFQGLLNTLSILAPVSPPPTIPTPPKEVRVFSHGKNWIDSSDSEEEMVDPREYDDNHSIHFTEPEDCMKEKSLVAPPRF